MRYQAILEDGSTVEYYIPRSISPHRVGDWIKTAPRKTSKVVKIIKIE